MSYKLADGSLSTDYKLGDLFVYNDARGDDYGTYSGGSIVKFLKNDGSDCPLFSLVEGECFDDTFESCDTKTSYASWEKLTRYSGVSVAKEQDPDVVIKQSDYDSLVDEINMLRELVAELTSVKEEQQFNPISEMTLEDWQQAKDEGWEFETREGDVISATTLWSLSDAYPVRCSNGLAYTIRGYFWDSGKENDADIIKRIK
jgi:hypothetical protein